MRDDVLTSVSATFLEVVEQLTFMFGEPAAKSGVLDADGDYVLAQLDFTGDVTGRLSLAVPADCVPEIAANILGLEPEEMEASTMAPDSLGEMLNVICGHVIMAIAGKGADFRLGGPEVGPATPEFLAACVDDENWLGFLLEENVVLLGLVTE
ncbi:MAG: chemotaxis protein CheX [bacterium]|nr:chemotaxis protein CheX [bacterium]